MNTLERINLYTLKNLNVNKNKNGKLYARTKMGIIYLDDVIIEETGQKVSDYINSITKKRVCITIELDVDAIDDVDAVRQATFKCLPIINMDEDNITVKVI